jgi:aminotransferase
LGWRLSGGSVCQESENEVVTGWLRFFLSGVGLFHLVVRAMSNAFEAERAIAEHVRRIPRSGIREFFDIVQSMPEVISLGVGEPDFVTPWHIREAAIYALERGKTTYTSNLGSPRLREAISRYVNEKFGVRYDPKTQVLVAVGVSEALDIALRAVINPGDEILYHEPCYVSYAPSIALAHGKPVAIGCQAKDGFALTAEAIERAVTPRSKALVLNFPTNPTGGTMSREELERVAEVVRRHNLLVITDEIYSELTFEGGHVSLASLPGMAERTIFLHGFSKGFAMTGFRIGYACGPTELVEAMMRIHQYSMLCASIISQEAAIEALENGEASSTAMRDQYALRRNVIVGGFNSMGLKCHLPRGSFYAFPCIESTGLSSREFAVRLLKEEQVACVPGDAFGPSGSGYLRCCFATALDLIEEALERMDRFVGRLKSAGG